ncbi:MAG: RuBisCO large subunit C-terminal-like domain-containing protein, partial [Pseudomonadota bacterium]
MPVFSSGQTALQAIDTFRAYGSTDLIFAAGGGIMGHPMGIEAGVASLRRAWAAAVAGESLETAAAEHPELAAAIGAYRR